MKDSLENVVMYAQQALDQLKETPDKEYIHRLLQAVEEIDYYYRIWCDKNDKETNVPAGTSYTFGTFADFAVSSSSWYEVSLALRELNEGK
jgi:hypothetical protein